MSAPVRRWMRRAGLETRAEFVTPWGICDFVGVRFNSANVARRIALNQTRAVSSLIRAILLLRIPDVESGLGTSAYSLTRSLKGSIPAEMVSKELERLIVDSFVIRSRGRLQRQNGWMPLHERIVAIELKLSRVKEAILQASNHIAFADESYVGLPRNRAKEIASSPAEISRLRDAGVGLLAVGLSDCEILFSAPEPYKWKDKAVQFHCVEKFWSSRTKDR